MKGGFVLIAADYPFLDIVGTMLVFFGWVIWFWLLITVLSDVFRRHDISGWGKAGWTLVTIFLPLLGVLVYLGLQGKHMAERNVEAARTQQKEFDSYVRQAAGANGGPTEQIAKAKQLLDTGAISQAEFDQIKRTALT
jgi:hypothetical protein